jgi:hypothetical protein
MFLKIAHAQFIELPSGLAADVASTTSNFLSSPGVASLVALIVGTLLAVLVLGIIVNTFHNR